MTKQQLLILLSVFLLCSAGLYVIISTHVLQPTEYYCGGYYDFPYGPNHSMMKACVLNCVHGYDPLMRHWAELYPTEYLRQSNGDVCAKIYY
jgi:hypothetical protein